MAQNDIIYGLHAVTAVLQQQPHTVLQLLIQDSRHDQRLRTVHDLAKHIGVSIKVTKREELERLAGNTHQGVVAYIKQHISYTEADLANLLASLEQPAFLLILDGVQDPHNLGACLRSANAAGVHAVIAPKDNAVALTPVVRKVASGAAEVTPFIMVTNLARTLRTLKEGGIWVYGTSDQAEKTVFQTDLKGPIAIVLGAEGKGMRRLTQECCDAMMQIPMKGNVSSLNVSVATGICLFEAVRQSTLLTTK